MKGISLGRPADPAAVEKIRRRPVDIGVHIDASPAEAVEQAGPLDEKRPLLFVVSLISGEVDDGRVDFDLSEIRVDRGVQGQVAFQADLEVESEVAEEALAGLERIARLGRLELGLADRIGHELQVRPGMDVPDALQPGEAGDIGDLFFGDPDQAVLFVLPLNDPFEIDSPNVFVFLRESKLVEGDAHLHSPALGVDLSLPIPDRVPGRIRLDVVGQGQVDDRAGRVDT